MSFRLRLTLFGVGVVALAMVTFAVALLGLARRAAPDDQAGLLATTAAEVGDALTRSQVDDGLIAPVLVEVNSNNPSVFIQLIDPSGAVTYSAGRLDGPLPQPPANLVVEARSNGSASGTVTADGRELRVHLTRSGDTVVLAGQATDAVLDQLAGLQAVVWIAVIITLIAATVVSWIVAGRAIRPLRHLAATTDEIGTTGDLTRRLPAQRRNDEVGRLTASFNAMLDGIADSRRRLAGSLDAQRRFVADASHELRTPLTSIHSNAGFLQDRPDAESDDRQAALNDIVNEANRMTRQIDDLLTLAALDDRPPVEPVPVDLTGIVADGGRALQKDGHEVVLDVAPGIRVTGDQSDLQRLVRILLDNAIKYGVAPVEIRLAAAGNRAALVVADNGPGFPPDDLDLVFDRFYRADPARPTGGSGLGLAIARASAERHGGSITAANRPGGGGAVSVSLPLST
ncbi:MAG: HAMP domain-containing histidine kinase [Acidimicrobiia bacterium]|nr:HAMP domain-containing histidine kinase [Acidimicrobiia bacterium]